LKLLIILFITVNANFSLNSRLLFFIIKVLFCPLVLERWVLSKALIKEKGHECNWTNRWAILLSGSNWMWEALVLWLQRLRCAEIPIHSCADCVQKNLISFPTWSVGNKINIFNNVCLSIKLTNAWCYWNPLSNEKNHIV